MKLILASASPRRVELLHQMGLEFKIVPSQIIEDNTLHMPPQELASWQAKAKAVDVASSQASGLVLGADTIVVLNGHVYGKPQSPEMARNMLSDLAGKTHEVITGVALIDAENNTQWTDYAVTKVKMAAFADCEIERYVNTGEPLDKAGAYAIQEKGAMLVESITGCYTNVVGLPIPLVYKLLKNAGMNVL
ncbi:MAG: Maf family protein [Pelosinus sp.]|nr:Maf family protein [Pelosinus sp.]